MQRTRTVLTALGAVLATLLATLLAGSVSAAADGGRTERWHGVQVRVPASWVLGPAPVRSGGEALVCGDQPDRPYVGRPIPESDACSVFDPDAVPATDSVWLGTDLEPGTDDLGDGWTRETVAVAGTTVTVTSKDDALRTEVLGSAGPVTRCEAALDSPPRAVRQATVEGIGELVRARLCAYRREDGAYRLVHGARVGPRVVAGTRRTADRAPRRERACPGPRPDELVVVTARFTDPYGADPTAGALTHRFVHEYGPCSQVRAARYHRPGQSPRRVTEPAVLPWATPRFRHLLVGPRTSWAYDHFIGVQG